MPAKYTLSRADFARMRGFKRVHGTLFSLSYGTLPGRTVPGAACVVSAKTAPRAAVRNLIKRRSRAALLPVVRHLSAPLILVWHAKKPAIGASQQQIQEEMLQTLRKTGAMPASRDL